MAKQWKFKYGENEIVVKNEQTTAYLYVNGKLLDSSKGLFHADLEGKLDTGEIVKATIGDDLFKVDCKLSVNYVYMAPIEVV